MTSWWNKMLDKETLINGVLNRGGPEWQNRGDRKTKSNEGARREQAAETAAGDYVACRRGTVSSYPGRPLVPHWLPLWQETTRTLSFQSSTRSFLPTLLYVSVSLLYLLLTNSSHHLILPLFAFAPLICLTFFLITLRSPLTKWTTFF